MTMIELNFEGHFLYHLFIHKKRSYLPPELCAHVPNVSCLQFSTLSKFWDFEYYRQKQFYSV